MSWFSLFKYTKKDTSLANDGKFASMQREAEITVPEYHVDQVVRPNPIPTAVQVRKKIEQKIAQRAAEEQAKETARIEQMKVKSRTLWKNIIGPAIDAGIRLNTAGVYIVANNNPYPTELTTELQAKGFTVYHETDPERLIIYWIGGEDQLTEKGELAKIDAREYFDKKRYSIAADGTMYDINTYHPH
jgi:hypothetical protein